MPDTLIPQINKPSDWKNVLGQERDQYLASTDPAEQARLVDAMAEKILAYVRVHPDYDYGSAVFAGFMGRGPEEARRQEALFQLTVTQVTRKLIEEKLLRHQFDRKLKPSDWAEENTNGIGKEISQYLATDDEKGKEALLDVMTGKVLAYLEAFPEETDSIAESLRGAFIQDASEAKSHLYEALVEKIKRAQKMATITGDKRQGLWSLFSRLGSGVRNSASKR